MKTAFHFGEPVKRPPALHDHLRDDLALDQAHRQGAEVTAVSGPGEIVSNDVAVTFRDLDRLLITYSLPRPPQYGRSTYLYHIPIPYTRRVQQDVIPRHTHDALYALLAGLDGDGVHDAIADADAAAAAVGSVCYEPLVPRLEGGEHGGPPPVPRAVPVCHEHVAESHCLDCVEEYPEGVTYEG